jgi:hypothetical protein
MAIFLVYKMKTKKTLVSLIINKINKFRQVNKMEQIVKTASKES